MSDHSKTPRADRAKLTGMRAVLVVLTVLTMAPAGVAGLADQGLSLRAEGFVSRAAGRVRVTLVVDVDEPGAAAAKLSSASVALIDANGAPAGRWKATAQQLSAVPLAATLDVPPGAYRARVSVTDAKRRTGASEIAIDATLTPAAGGLSLSSMSLGTNDAAFVPKLRFTTEPVATARFELYGGRAGMPVSVAMAIAMTPDGVPLATLKPAVAATPEPDRFVVTTAIDIATLPPGDYVIRAIVGIDGFPSTRLARVLRKRAR